MPRPPRRRFVSRSRKPIRRKPLWLERLEDRVVPTVIDLTKPGNTGTLNGGLFFQSSGSGIQTFVRLSTNQPVEQGYNTDFTPHQFDEVNNTQYTHSQQLSSVPTVIGSGGLAYYEFLLNINQLSSSPLLSVDQLRFYVTNSSTVDPTMLHNYDASAHTLQDDGGHPYSPVYDLNPNPTDANYIQLNYSLATGNSTGDMVALIPATLLGTDLNQYVYLYSQLGVHNANNDGFDEWLTADALPVGSISGQAFIDQNGNSMLDPGEPGLGGVTVYLDANNNGSPDPGEVSTMTKPDGSFSFSRLLPGTYQVREVAPSGYIQTDPINNGSATITVTGGQNVTGVNFGNFKLGTISGTKFEDTTGNGSEDIINNVFIPDADDPVLNSANPDFVPVTMQLLQGGTVIATTTTGTDGTYTFTGVGPGTLGPNGLPEPYTVAEVKPNGWIQTAATTAPITPTSGFASTNNNFDNYLVAQVLSNNVLAIRTTQTGTDPLKYNLSVVQDSANMIDITVTLNNVSQSAGSFPVAGLVNVTVTTFGGFTIDTSQVGTLPVVTNVQGGNNNFVGGSSSSTVNLNSGGADSLSVSGGQNTLNFSPTSFGVTFNAGIQGTSQALDPTGKHSLKVNGAFQTVDGTNFSDTLTAALPTFNPITGFVSAGTTIFSGLGQDTVIGTLGTKAQTDGSGSQYNEVLSAAAIAELQAAIQSIQSSGMSASVLNGFTASVTMNGGSSTASASLMTKVTLSGTQNSFVQAVDTGAAQVLEAAISAFGAGPGGAGIFGAGPGGGGIFGANVTASGTNNFIQADLLTTAALGSQNNFVQALDSNSVQVLEAAISAFGAGPGGGGIFGAGPGGGGIFGANVTASGTNNFIQADLLTTAMLTGGQNKFLQTVDSNSAQVLDAAIKAFGAGPGGAGIFGGPGGGGIFGANVTASGTNNFIQADLLTTAMLTGGQNTFLQTVDTNSVQVLGAAISAFGAGPGGAGIFGAGPGGGGIFGANVTASGTNNFIQASLLTTAMLTGGQNTFLQTVDTNSVQVLDTAISAFGAGPGGGGIFGAGPGGGGIFGANVTASGTNNFIQASLLTTATLNGGQNIFLQTVDTNSVQVLDTAINAFGAGPGGGGIFGAGPGGGGIFGANVTANGTNNFIEASLLTTVTLPGGQNTFVQTVDNNSVQVLNAALTFGAGPGGGGIFGAGPGGGGIFGANVTASGTNTFIQASLLTRATINGNSNTITQALDNNSVQVLTSPTALSFGAGPGGGGIFGANVTATGTNNFVQADVMTTVTFNGSDNRFMQSLDANGLQVLNAAVGFGVGPTGLGHYGVGVTGSGGFNNAQAGVLANVHLSGGEDTFVELLTQGEVSFANSVLAAVSGGQSAVDAAASSIGLHVVLGDGDEVIVGGLLGYFQAGNGNDRFVIEDPSLLGATSVNATLLKYGGSFTAGTGNNTYYFVGQDLGHVAVNQASTAATDTLDFSRFQSGITLNLGQTGEQTLSPGLLYLTLSDGMGISNVVGTGFSDAITLNGRNGTISGQALLDPRAANAPAPHAVPTQVVFLDFDTYTTDPTKQHVYTLQERQSILTILQTDYALFPFVQFTMTAPTSGAFETLFFNRSTNATEGGVGGNSSEIDFRNLNLSATAEINVNGFIGTSPGQVPAADPVTGQDNWVTLSATIAAHELGHTLGELHEFSFGPVGFGIHNPPGNNAYLPPNPSPDAAWETAMHIMASPASVGSTLFDAAGHPFFGEREAIALAYINDGTVVDNTQTPVTNNSMMQAQSLTTMLTGLQVPNPATSGFEFGMQYSVAATDVVDSIGLDSTGHSQDKWYSFAGKQGDLMNFDVMSFHLTRITDPVDTVLTIYDSHGNIVAYYNGKAQNDDNFETGDAHIIDLKLPADDTYFVKVDSFTDPSIQPGQPGYSIAEATDTETGHYELLIYRSTVGNPIKPSSHDTVVLGSGQETVYGVDPTNPMVNPQAVTYNGVEGTSLSLAVATFGDPGTPATANFSATVDWGDGTPASAATVSINGSTVTILGSHPYAEEGTYTTTLTLNEGSALSVILKGKASISDAQLTNAAVSAITPTEGVAFSGTLATFVDPGGSEPVGDYVATINWGDNSPVAAGTIVSNGNGQFSVTGTHTYNDEGSFPVTVTITHDKLAAITASATIKVSDAPLSATATNSSLILNQGLPLNTQVASFTDANLLAPLTDFTAAPGGVTIAWGDGSSSAGLVTQPGGLGTKFFVSASHAYSVDSSFTLTGTFTVTVNIADAGGQTASTSFTVTVKPSIILLNPTVSGALTLTGKVAINIGGAVVVDSSSTSALSAGGTTQITANTIQVVGGVSANNGAILSPTPITGIKPVPDPLANLPAPVVSGTNQGIINLTKGTGTIGPGIYTQISVSGTGTTLYMTPGIYVITGGGFSVSNSANVTVTGTGGVMIYNAGSNYGTTNTGGTFGAISLGSSGKINLSAPTTGLYAGVLIFQSRDNTRALSLNASSAVGIIGTVYAPAALMSLGGSATLKSPVIVNQLTLNGNGGSALTADGTVNATSAAAGQLLGGDLFLYVNDPNGLFTADELARLADTITGLDNLLAPYSVTITEVTDATLANLILDTGDTSAAGGLADGVLGCFVTDGVTGEITLVQGWNWYTGADPTLIGSNQYDFQTILTHEMGHALGLGHSADSTSVMYAELPTGVAHRNMTVQDLNIPDPGTGPDGLHAAQLAVELAGVSPDLPQLMDQSRLSVLAGQSTLSLQTLGGFDFTLADCFRGDLPSTGQGLEALETSPFRLTRRTIGAEAIISAGLGSGLALLERDFEQNPMSLERGDKNPPPSNSLRSLPLSNPSLRAPLNTQNQIEKAIPSSPKPPVGLWETAPVDFCEPEIVPLTSSGSLSMRLWDLDETLGWLLFGMFMVPPEDVFSERQLKGKRAATSKPRV